MDRSSDAPSGDDAPSCPPATRPDPRFSAPPPWLQRFVEHELVPHLLDPTRSPARRPAPADALRSADVEALVELLLADDSPGCDAWIDALRGAGIDADRLCDELTATVRCVRMTCVMVMCVYVCQEQGCFSSPYGGCAAG